MATAWIETLLSLALAFRVSTTLAPTGVMASNATSLTPFESASSTSVAGTYRPPHPGPEIIVQACVDKAYYNQKEVRRTIPFADWASTKPGDVVVASKDRNTYHGYISASTNTVAIVPCAEGLSEKDDGKFEFIGVARTGINLSTDTSPADFAEHDELCTVTTHGIVNVLNNSATHICPGDLIGWTFGKSMQDHDAPRRGRAKFVPRIQICRMDDRDASDWWDSLPAWKHLKMLDQFADSLNGYETGKDSITTIRSAIEGSINALKGLLKDAAGSTQPGTYCDDGLLTKTVKVTTGRAEQLRKDVETGEDSAMRLESVKNLRCIVMLVCQMVRFKTAPQARRIGRAISSGRVGDRFDMMVDA